MNTASTQHAKKKKNGKITKIGKLQTYFFGKRIFGNDKSQNYSVFQPILEYLQTTATINNYRALDLKSKGLSN